MNNSHNIKEKMVEDNKMEYRARLPWIDKISTAVLEARVKLGIRRTLQAVEALAGTIGGDASTQRQAISACNFSASQCTKELKKRGVVVR